MLTAKEARGLIYPEQGSSEFFERHKLVVKGLIEKAVVNREYDCLLVDSDLYIGSPKGKDEIVTYLEELGYSVERCIGEKGLGIKISWGWQ